MKDIFFTHRGHYEKDGLTYSDGNQTHLLHGEKDFEAVVEMIPKGVVGYIYTVHETSFEFSYLLKGSIEFMEGDEFIVIHAGDTYSHHNLKRKVMFRALEDSEILGINTNPCYETYVEDQELLTEVLQNLQKVDGDTLNHCTRVKDLSMGIAYFLRYDQAGLLDLFCAANFHDVGKSKIPVEILLKPGRLTAEEFAIMKEHSRYTYEMILKYYGDTIANIAFEHHEKLDGTGYPRGLKGDQISLPARIICVADAYDAMVVTRPYRTGLSQEEAMAELHRCSGTQFDSTVVEALEKYLASK